MLNCHSCLSILFSVTVALGVSAACAQNPSTSSGQAASTGSGQAYPIKPVRIITSGVGTGADTAARLLAQNISGPLGQQVIVDNRPSGVIPGQVVAQAAPDGYTILYSGSALWLGPLMRPSSPYDPLKDFAPITQSLRQPALLVVHPALPVKSVKEFVALAKSRPGALNYGTGSTGSLTHLAAEFFQSIANVKFVRIPYKSGGGQATMDLIAGEIQLMFAVTASLMPHVKTGRMKALGVTTAQPTPLVPGVPTIASGGLPGYESVSNVGIFAPAKTSRAIVDRLNQEFARALHRQEVKDKFLADGVETIGGTAEQFEAVIKAEIASMGKVIKDRGIREE